MPEMPGESPRPRKLSRAERLAAEPKPAPKVPPRKPPRRPAAEPEQQDAFDFASISGGSTTDGSLYVRRDKKPAWLPWVLVGGVAVLILIIGLVVSLVGSGSPPMAIRPIGDQTVDELTPLRLTVEVDTPEGFTGELRYSLKDAPEGASIDARSGEFAWQPTEAQGPGWHDVTVRVATVDNPKQAATAKFSVDVREVNVPPVFQPVEEQVTSLDAVFSLVLEAEDPDDTSPKLNYRLVPGGPAGASVDADTGKFRWNPREAEPGEVYHFTVRATEAIPNGLTATLDFDVRLQQPAVMQVANEPKEHASPDFPVVTRDPGSNTNTDTEFPAPVAVQPGTSPSEEANEKILALFKERTKLSSRAQYPALRKIYADWFEREHGEAIKQAYGEDYDEMTAWLDEHVDVKEEFYTAIRPDVDKVVPALRLLGEIRKQFPKQIAAYGELAIATAVTWDDPRGIYNYAGHSRRTKSKMPEGLLGALENFQYLLDAEELKLMQGRIRFMPWEFLTLTVNHKTPLPERQWAMTNYLPKRRMFGKCYGEVPYDNLMLNSGSKSARLNDQDYTLPNLRQFGGVCAMQADFASRVGKSIGVPAAYVGGEAQGGEHHAWVMWVELLGATATSINFSLQSHGRYRGDKYYVGNLSDPQSGRHITDRQLELRLHTVGRDPLAKRHAQLVMKSYPMLRRRTEMDVTGQLTVLHEVTDLCPGNEAAWVALAKMSREGVVTKKHLPAMTKVLDRFFRTFANFPDFTWELFDDLIAFQDVPKQRSILYGRLVQMYELAGRPDLACKARLKYTEYLLADKQHGVAIDGLALTIMKFPEEGRYVPKMLDRLEAICNETEGKEKDLLNFYKLFLPKVPQMRGDRPSPYCIKMFERAMQRFQAAGDLQSTAMCEAQLGRLRGAPGMMR